MAPAEIMTMDTTHVVTEQVDLGIALVDMASQEIETMRLNQDKKRYHSFPKACLTLLKGLEGNTRCVDCGEHDPQWAAVSYGALLCLNCSGHHRSLGVNVSCVRSITMDEWSLDQIVTMLEGGNGQLLGFFSRHALTEHSYEEAVSSPGKSKVTKDNVTRFRYRTKAALFYRKQMELHVENVLGSGPYKGREISRRLRRPRVDHRNSTLA